MIQYYFISCVLTLIIPNGMYVQACKECATNQVQGLGVCKKKLHLDVEVWKDLGRSRAPGSIRWTFQRETQQKPLDGTPHFRYYIRYAIDEVNKRYK